MTHEYEKGEGLSCVTQDPSKTLVNVVFVHGLGGGAYSTWDSGAAPALGFWPAVVAREHPQCCVWTVNYTARILEWNPFARSRSVDLLDRAAWLADLLAVNEIAAKPIVFVAHSLGGLLVKQVLQFSQFLGPPSWRLIWEQTQAVLFLATPHGGSALSDVATVLVAGARGVNPLTRLFLRPSPALANLKRDNPVLRYLGDWYSDHAQAQGIRTIAYAEGRNSGGATLVVSQGSASPHVANVIAVPLPDEDHSSISKPRDKTSRVCLSLDACLEDVELRASRFGMGQGSLRTPLDQQTLGGLAENRRLISRISGAWWERMATDALNRISFFQIVPDMLFNSVSLVGTSYDDAGETAAGWNSVIARVEKRGPQIIVQYLWQGKHVTQALANVPFHGFGSLYFDETGAGGDAVSRGSGTFWEVDEFHPEKTVLKPIELRRVAVQEQVQVMTQGTGSARQALATQILENWHDT